MFKNQEKRRSNMYEFVRKIDLFGTYDQFMQAQEEQKLEEPEAEMERPQQSQQLDRVQDKSGGPPQVAFGHPNIIGNIEDMANLQVADGQQISSIDPNENQGDQSMEED